MWTRLSRLIWHNFVKIGDNCIKICNLAYIITCNGCVKNRLKILNRLWKNKKKFRWPQGEFFGLTLYRNFGKWYQSLHNWSVHVLQLIKNYKAYIMRGDLHPLWGKSRVWGMAWTRWSHTHRDYLPPHRRTYTLILNELNTTVISLTKTNAIHCIILILILSIRCWTLEFTTTKFFLLIRQWNSI